MADPVYEIKTNPSYDTQIRALQDSDPARASTVFNPLIQALIDNIHYVKLAADQIADGLFRLEITFDAALAGKGFTVEGGGFSYSGTVPDGLTATVGAPGPNTVYTVTCQTTIRTVETTSCFGIYPVTMDVIPDVLENATWAQIADAAAAGTIPAAWEVGDTKDVTLTTGETLTFQIYGFNHDDLADGAGKAAITFGMKDLMAGTRQMNATPTNSGGFIGSQMCQWLTATVWEQLPDDLKAAIQPALKVSGTASLEMPVFLFSEFECLGSNSLVSSTEGAQYPIFTGKANLDKYLSNGAGAKNDWWLRSVFGSQNFVLVQGRITNAATASNAHGVCFGFCV